MTHIYLIYLPVKSRHIRPNAVRPLFGVIFGRFLGVAGGVIRPSSIQPRTFRRLVDQLRQVKFGAPLPTNFAFQIVCIARFIECPGSVMQQFMVVTRWANNQIRIGVVVAVLIGMMDDLIFLERPTQHSLCN